MEIWIVTIILVVTVFLLITEKMPLDVISMGIIVVLSISRILTPSQAVSGFANPAVITVAAMFLISRGMIRTGVVESISASLIHMSRGKAKLAILLIFLVVALSSAFINNTPVVVLFIPVVMSMCCEFGLSPSKYLIPLSYVSILAGTCTLIGTSTNIIVSDLSAGYGYGAFGMFELAKIGIPIAIVGIAAIWLMASRWLPDMVNPTCELESDDNRKYLAELILTENNAFIGKNIGHLFADVYSGLDLIELVRQDHIFYPDRDLIQAMAGDRLLVKGPASDLMQLLSQNGVILPQEKNIGETEKDKETILIEIVIPPLSSILGSRIIETKFFRDPVYNVIAIQRSGLQYSEKKIQNIKLKVGDILLVQLPWDKLDQLRHENDFLIVEDIHNRIIDRSKAHYAGLIFASIIILASTGLLDIMVCAITGVFLMFITGCLKLREAYRSMQGNVLMLIAGTIALGQALDKTGASSMYAHMLLKLLDGLSPIIILGAIILLTSVSTQLLSNNATAVLILPIAISAASALGINPKPFIVGVCIGASACFATPIGYQTNLLVYGPGGYRFTDYLKLGMPLNALVLIMGTLLIPFFWPF